MLKSLDKKFLIMAGLIIFVPIFVMILFSVLQGCQNKGNSYDSYELAMKNAATKYFKTKKLLPSAEGGISEVSLETLVSNGLIKSPKKKLKDSSCTGNVKARLNGSSLEKNEGGFLNYLVYLKCENYETNIIESIIKKNIVTTESGLYQVGDEYLFKGNNVKNYINFYGKPYRIMGITSDGLIKLVKSETETISRMWDNKYNIEPKFSYGKTIYKDSLILQYLLSDYFNAKKISAEARKHIVARDACIGKRAKSNKSIDKSLDCSEVLEKQLISIITVSDYFLASTDPDCNSITSRSCNNYNYLYHVASSTWTSTAITDNTYEVLYIGGGSASAMNANEYNPYNIVIYIDGYEIVDSGTGTVDNPFEIN